MTLELTLQIQSKIFSFENCPNWARLLSKFTLLNCLLTEAWGRSTEPLETMAWVITTKASQRNFVKECLYGDRKLQLCSTGNECYDEWSPIIITTTNWVRELIPVKIFRRPLNPGRCASWTPFRMPWLQLHRYALCTTVTKLAVLKMWYGKFSSKPTALSINCPTFFWSHLVPCFF